MLTDSDLNFLEFIEANSQTDGERLLIAELAAIVNETDADLEALASALGALRAGGQIRAALDDDEQLDEDDAPEQLAGGLDEVAELRAVGFRETAPRVYEPVEDHPPIRLRFPVNSVRCHAADES